LLQIRIPTTPIPWPNRNEPNRICTRVHVPKTKQKTKTKNKKNEKKRDTSLNEKVDASAQWRNPVGVCDDGAWSGLFGCYEHLHPDRVRTAPFHCGPHDLPKPAWGWCLGGAYVLGVAAALFVSRRAVATCEKQLAKGFRHRLLSLSLLLDGSLTHSLLLSLSLSLPRTPSLSSSPTFPLCTHTHSLQHNLVHSPPLYYKVRCLSR
jgi:hypothetical protein